jgi:uncharacterized membrane protein
MMRVYPWHVSRSVMAGLVLLLLLLFAPGGPATAAVPAPLPGDLGPPAELTGDGVVRGVLFYSPTCPHCHVVMDDVLPPLRRAFGKRVLLAEVNAMTPAGQEIWRAAVEAYRPSVQGFPTLMIGEYALIGSREIPQALPGLIESYLDAGGVGWPAIDGLDAAVAGLEPAGSPNLLAQVGFRFQRDLAGNTMALLVLAGLVAGLIAVARPRQWQKDWAERAGAWLLLPLVLGLLVSLYLTQVEVSGADAVCGPVGDCNAVQQSPYALLFGVLPVALLGVIGYLSLLFTYGMGLWTGSRIRRHLPGALFVMAVLGLGFATYLTFLEPFVIGATCAWCLTQAVCMLAVALLTAGPGWASLRPAASPAR